MKKAKKLQDLKVDNSQLSDKEWLNRCKQSIEDAKLTKEEGDYNGMVGRWILELCRTFQKQDHSSISAQQTAQLFVWLVVHNGFFPKLDS